MEGKIVQAFVVVALSIMVILDPSLAASDLSLNVASATTATYSKVLTDMRNNLQDPKLKYGNTNIPVMAAPSKTPKYLLVDLKASDGGTITVAFSKTDLYVQGYLDKFNNGKDFRAHFFPDALSDAKKTLFPEAKVAANRIEMKYKSSYGDIEKKAGDRSKLGLGVQPLNKLINKVYGKPLDVKTEAQLMLLVIQMLAEATRFKYIEGMILQKFSTFYNPDPKTIELEKSWQKITKGIKSSIKGVIKPELVLVDDKGKPWKVSKVDQVVPVMGLLKYEGSSSSITSKFYKVLMNVFKVNNGNGETAEL